MVALVETISALKAEISLLRAHLELEASLTAALRNNPRGSEMQSSLVAAAAVEANPNLLRDLNLVVLSNPDPMVLIAPDPIVPLVFLDSDSGPNLVNNYLSSPELCGLSVKEAPPVDASAAVEENESVNLDANVNSNVPSVCDQPRDVKDCSAENGASTIYWHDGEGTFVHPASGVQYLPENDTFYSFISDYLDDSRVLFYNAKNGSFVLAREGSFGK